MEHFSFISAQTRLLLLLYETLADSLYIDFAPLIFPCFLNTGFPACSTSCLLGQSNYYLSSLWKQCLHAFSKCQCLPVSRRKMCWWHSAEECRCTFLPWWDTEWDPSWICLDCEKTHYMSLNLHSQCGQGGAAEQINIPLWWWEPWKQYLPYGAAVRNFCTAAHWMSNMGTFTNQNTLWLS